MPTIQWFPLDMTATPFPPVGTPDEPYPDYRTYTHRDYGNRVGIFRIMAALDRLGLPATCRVNGIIAKRYPELVAEVVGRRWEVAAYGWHMRDGAWSSSCDLAAATTSWRMPVTWPINCRPTSPTGWPRASPRPARPRPR